MNTRRVDRILMIFICSISAFAASCSPDEASEEEIELMCNRLMTLHGLAERNPVGRGQLSDVATTRVTTMGKCRIDSIIVQTSKEAVHCRLQAKDVYNFWICPI